MSHSITLYCEETKQMVNVAEQSSSWFRGADNPNVVGAFCLAHAGKALRSTLVQPVEFDDCMDWEQWTPENCHELYHALVGEKLQHLTV
ncbi:hypothetical protein G3N96_05090 [Burkholderia sp. Se-20373]|uniref:hypothetical protein n=1 Tax=Burkholderia sp. Se-20373 TaxID=2703898 RepID=UPI00197E4EB6|nr:hypothetical protein [Burkholderia sp. Se-20373]MBN3744811.1 hypothetical protein [Burkholderia sp. Se-20373]